MKMLVQWLVLLFFFQMVSCSGSDSATPIADNTQGPLSLGGEITGLNGTIILQNNSTDNLTISAGGGQIIGGFTFPDLIAAGSSYSVTVLSQPAGQFCTVSNGSGTTKIDNIDSILISCTDTAIYTVGGSVTGLTTTVTLTNGGEDLDLINDGAFQFLTKQIDGASYSVTVKTDPDGQECTIANGTGNITSASVTNVTVECFSNVLSGRAFKGPVQQATVEVYLLNSDGSKGKLLGTTRSDSSGNFTLSEIEILGQPLLVEVSGGWYVNEITSISKDNYTQIPPYWKFSDISSSPFYADSLGYDTEYFFTMTAVNSYGESDEALEQAATTFGLTTQYSFPPWGGHSCLVLADQSLVCWGSNGYGQFGPDTLAGSFMPTVVPGISGVEKVSIGQMVTCALLNDQSVQCWGHNYLFGTVDNVYSPTVITGISSAVDLSNKGLACAVIADGTIKCWGTSADPSIPDTVPGISTAIAVGTGWGHACGVLADGSLQCWGNNNNHQVNPNTLPDTTSPATVPGVVNVVAVTGGQAHTCALISDGTINCWGNPQISPLGEIPDPNNYFNRVTVNGIANAVAVEAGEYFTCALLADGTVKCWGKNNYGTLGDSTTSDSIYPVPVSGISTATELFVGVEHACARLADKNVVCWGRNESGQLGNAVKDYSPIPVPVGGICDGVTVDSDPAPPRDLRIQGGYNSQLQTGDVLIHWSRACGAESYNIYVASVVGPEVSIQHDGADVLLAVVPPGVSEIAITPLTNMGAVRARESMAVGISTDQAVSSANIGVARQYGLADILQTLPVAANDSTQLTGATIEQKKYGLVLAGLVQLAKELDLTTITLVNGLSDDIRDGILDGMNGSTQIYLTDQSGNPVALPASTGTSDLHDGVATFSASLNNQVEQNLISTPISPVEVGINLAGKFYVTSPQLPAWYSNQQGSYQLTASGGTPPYKCVLKTGSALPAGFTISPDCLISGTGPVLNNATTSISPPFSIVMSDSAIPPAMTELELQVTTLGTPPSLAVSDSNCVPDEVCTINVQASGGVGPYYYTLDSGLGFPPFGMSGPDLLTGQISGTPTVIGDYTFGICVVDLVGDKTCKTVTVSVAEPPPPPPPDDGTTDCNSPPTGWGSTWWASYEVWCIACGGTPDVSTTSCQ